MNVRESQPAEAGGEGRGAARSGRSGRLSAEPTERIDARGAAADVRADGVNGAVSVCPMLS